MHALAIHRRRRHMGGPDPRPELVEVDGAIPIGIHELEELLHHHGLHLPRWHIHRPRLFTLGWWHPENDLGVHRRFAFHVMVGKHWSRQDGQQCQNQRKLAHHTYPPSRWCVAYPLPIERICLLRKIGGKSAKAVRILTMMDASLRRADLIYTHLGEVAKGKVAPFRKFEAEIVSALTICQIIT